MAINTSQIKELRTATGAGVMECRRALEETGGDLVKAKVILAESAEKTAKKMETNKTDCGIVESYIHGNGRIGVLLELHCQTDFLSGSKDFHSLARDIAMHVASEAPLYISPSDVPNEVITKLEVEAEANALAMGKSDKVIPHIKTGKVKKYLSQTCLLEQKFIKDSSITISGLLNVLSARTSERIRVANFTRYEIQT